MRLSFQPSMPNLVASNFESAMVTCQLSCHDLPLHVFNTCVHNTRPPISRGSGTAACQRPMTCSITATFSHSCPLGVELGICHRDMPAHHATTCHLKYSSLAFTTLDRQYLEDQPQWHANAMICSAACSPRKQTCRRHDMLDLFDFHLSMPNLLAFNLEYAMATCQLSM